MIYKNYLDLKSNLLRNNRLLKLCIVVFALASMVSSVTAYRSLNYVRTSYVPMGYANQPINFTDTSINEVGAKIYTRYIFDLILNYTPSSAREKFTEAIPMIHTRYYDEANEDLMRQLETIERLRIVSSYQIEEIRINEQGRAIRVKGLRTRHTYGKKVDEMVEEWELHYEIVDANFKITRIKKIS